MNWRVLIHRPLILAIGLHIAPVGLHIGPIGLPLRSAASQTVNGRGLEIAKEVVRRSRGFEDFEAELEIRIHDPDGRERVRELTVRGLESPEGDRTVMVLRRPADLSGTAFLSILQGEGRRGQWIYLPAARRVRRIGGSQGSDPFLGSHFTYDDMTPPSIAGFSYRWVRDQEVAGLSGALVERCPSSCTEGAKRELLWIDTDRYLVHRVDYFDSAGVRRRTLSITDYQHVDGFWRALRMEMSDGKDGGRTVLTWSEVRLGIGLRERNFDPTRLGQVR